MVMPIGGGLSLVQQTGSTTGRVTGFHQPNTDGAPSFFDVFVDLNSLG
jgi:hypothetical protein